MSEEVNQYSLNLLDVFWGCEDESQDLAGGSIGSYSRMKTVSYEKRLRLRAACQEGG